MLTFWGIWTMRWVVTMVASAGLVACGPRVLLEDEEGSGSRGEGSTTSMQDSASSAEDTTAGGDCVPTTEICDDIDNDCDGLVDEDIAPVMCGVGRCEATVRCEDGVMPRCEPLPPSPEVCNLDDDDCDGEVDEGFGFGPLGDAIVLRTDEYDTGSCTTCSWAFGTALAPVDGGFLSLWVLGLYGGDEEWNLYGRDVDALGSPAGSIALQRNDFILELLPVQALEPMPPLGTPLAVEHRMPGIGDASGLLFVAANGSTELVRPIPGRAPSGVERTVWTGESFVTAWEEDDQLQVAVLGPNASQGAMVEVDPLERPASITLGLFPGRVGILVSRYRSDPVRRDQWFVLLDPQGEVVVPAHEIDVEYTTWQRLVGTEQGWLYIRPDGFDEPTTRQPLDVEGNPLAEAQPFADGRHLGSSGYSDTFVPRPGLGEIVTAWSGPDGGDMHVEFLDPSGEVLRGWSGPLDVDPGAEVGYMVNPHLQIVDDRVLVIWHGIAPDEQPNRVYVRAFGCVG